jgi:hypothetical protein
MLDSPRTKRKMAIKKALRGAMGGADLLKPKLSLGYIIGAIVAVAVLIFVVTGGKWLYAKARKLSEGVVPNAAKPDLRGKLGL